MRMLLGVTKVNTFKDLLRVVSNMESMFSTNISSFIGARLQRKKEANVAFTKHDDKMMANTNISGDYEEQKIGCILVGVGSSINIMPLKILKKIALDVKTYLMRRYPRVLSKFSEDLGAVTLNLQHGGLESRQNFM
jgi:hypothetical protein